MSEEPMPNETAISRRALAGLGGAVLLGGFQLAGASPAESAGKAPYIYTRGQWKARAPRGRAVVRAARPDHIVVHHTATANSADLSRRHALELSRRIQRYHMDHNHWSDTGQQFTISRGGVVMEGRNRALSAVRARRHVIGAHTAGHNHHTLGIECEGLYTNARPTPALWRSLVRLCAHLCSQYGLNPYQAIVGHRNYNRTNCPGNALYGQLPQLRFEVALTMALPWSATLADPLPDLGSAIAAPGREFDHGPAQSESERP